MAGMPLRKYIKIDLSILDNTSWAGAAGIGHRDDVSSWLRAISTGNNLHYTGAPQSSRPESQLSQKYGSRRTCRHYIIFDQSEASIWSCDLSAIIERKMYSCVLMNIHFVLFRFFVCM